MHQVWLDQKPTNETTTGRLPTGEKLSGKASYENFLRFYTTSESYTAESVNSLGWTQLEKLYEQAVQIAIKLKHKNETEAVREMKTELNLPVYFFNDTIIPDHENGEIGASRCRDMASAKVNCPVRYKAIQNWFALCHMALSKIEPLLVGLFHSSGTKATTPNCPIVMKVNFNPSVGAQSYR